VCVCVYKRSVTYTYVSIHIDIITTGICRRGRGTQNVFGIYLYIIFL